MIEKSLMTQKGLIFTPLEIQHRDKVKMEVNLELDKPRPALSMTTAHRHQNQAPYKFFAQALGDIETDFVPCSLTEISLISISKFPQWKKIMSQFPVLFQCRGRKVHRGGVDPLLKVLCVFSLSEFCAPGSRVFSRKFFSAI